MIEAKGLTKRYGATVAVDNLSFEVKPGKVTGFLGPNGAGKSTTMRMILGLDTPTAGDVTDRRPALPRPAPAADQGRRAAGRQVGAPEPVRPGPPGLDGRVQQAAEGLASTRSLEMVGLTAVANKRAGAYSLGMSQRLGIAGALLGDPEVLLFDEPVNGLDPEGIVWIRTFMHRLADEGRTVLVSSHLLSEMALDRRGTDRHRPRQADRAEHHPGVRRPRQRYDGQGADAAARPAGRRTAPAAAGHPDRGRRGPGQGAVRRGRPDHRPGR